VERFATERWAPELLELAFGVGIFADGEPVGFKLFSGGNPGNPANMDGIDGICG